MMGIANPPSDEKVGKKIEQGLAEEKEEVVCQGERENPEHDRQGIKKHGLGVRQERFATGGIGVPQRETSRLDFLGGVGEPRLKGIGGVAHEGGVPDKKGIEKKERGDGEQDGRPF